MPLRPLPYREVKRRLEAAGFVQVGQRGSHIKFAKEDAEGIRTVIVPHHREIAVGTLRSKPRLKSQFDNACSTLRSTIEGRCGKAVRCPTSPISWVSPR